MNFEEKDIEEMKDIKEETDVNTTIKEMTKTWNKLVKSYKDVCRNNNTLRVSLSKQSNKIDELEKTVYGRYTEAEMETKITEVEAVLYKLQDYLNVKISARNVQISDSLRPNENGVINTEESQFRMNMKRAIERDVYKDILDLLTKEYTFRSDTYSHKEEKSINNSIINKEVVNNESIR